MGWGRGVGAKYFSSVVIVPTGHTKLMQHLPNVDAV